MTLIYSLLDLGRTQLCVDVILDPDVMLRSYSSRLLNANLSRRYQVIGLKRVVRCILLIRYFSIRCRSTLLSGE